MNASIHPLPETPRIKQRCFRCFRPADLCFCPSIPSIDNRNDVLILQHRRERFHPFNTARIVQQSLQQCRLMVDHTGALAKQFATTDLSPNVGLLFPGDEAKLLQEVADDERPDQLVILDGTWSHAKTLIRDLPRLGTLPRYRLAPSSPGRYRIRREPNHQALSTLEATVAALRVLEPDTVGLDHLIGVFDQMIDGQIVQSKSNWRHNRRRRGSATNIPRSLSGDLSNIVVAYGEQTRGGAGQDRNGSESRLPIYWVAERLESGETFRCAIDSDSIHSSNFLERLRLEPDVFRDAVTIETFRERWKTFLRHDDRVVVYHPSTSKLLRNASAEFAPSTILKSVHIDPTCRGTLDEIAASLGIETQPRDVTRASERLACAIGLVRHMNSQIRCA